MACNSERGGLKDQIRIFNKISESQATNLNRNPYSETYERPDHKLTDNRYGRPEQGSKTERRGIAAGIHIFKCFFAQFYN